MRNFKIIFSLILITFLQLGCNFTDDSQFQYATQLGANTKKNVSGRILDENGNPISNAEVKIKNKSVLTDNNGFFIITDAEVFNNFGYAKVVKNGYIDASRSFVPNDGENKIEIIMIPESLTETIQTGVNSTVNLPNGTQVKFDGFFQNEQGNEYNGNVNVSMYHLEASDEDISSKMPGMLLANDTNDNLVGLETFGMIHVELKGTNGQKLQIKNGHTAEIKLKIDSTQLSSCPTNIPLWHFDETQGLWIEDGVASKVGDYYVGNVSHFSWWNCDAPFEQSFLRLKVKDQNGNPICGSVVTLKRQNSPYPSYGETDTDGFVSGIIPKNEILEIKVYNNQTCLSEIYSGNIGGFSQDVNEIEIIVNINPNQLIHVQGSLINCNSEVIQNGYAVFSILGSYYTTYIQNGIVDFNISSCSSVNTVEFSFYDFEENLSIENMTINVINNTINLNNIPICQITEFVSYKIDNQPVKTIGQNISFGINVYNQVNINASNTLYCLSLSGQATGSGINSLSSFLLNGTDFNMITQNSGQIQYNSSPIGNIGEYVDITFNGIYNDTSGSHELSGVMHVKRDY